MTKEWQVQEAKNKFSEVLEQAAIEPQVITRHGKKAGVLLSYADYEKRILRKRRSLRNLYAGVPKFDPEDLRFERDRDVGRDFRL